MEDEGRIAPSLVLRPLSNTTKREVWRANALQESFISATITLRRTTLPKAGDTFHGETITDNWQLKPLPPARIWIAIVTPDRLTRKQAKIAWRSVWHHLNPARRVAAKIWIDHTTWRRRHADDIVPLGEPKPHHIREHDRFQPEWWRGADMTRTAAPVWVPHVWQHALLAEGDVTGETTAHRTYAPLWQ